MDFFVMPVKVKLKYFKSKVSKMFFWRWKASITLFSGEAGTHMWLLQSGCSSWLYHMPAIWLCVTSTSFVLLFCSCLLRLKTLWCMDCLSCSVYRTQDNWNATEHQVIEIMTTIQNSLSEDQRTSCTCAMIRPNSAVKEMGSHFSGSGISFLHG